MDSGLNISGMTGFAGLQTEHSENDSKWPKILNIYLHYFVYDKIAQGNHCDNNRKQNVS